MRVTVYAGSSSAGHTRDLREIAARFGRELAESGAEIAHGGDRMGLMGAVTDAALGAGGTVIAVIPESPAAADVSHHEPSRLHVVPDVKARRRLLWELGDCFVAFPGSLGRLEELFESWLRVRARGRTTQPADHPRCRWPVRRRGPMAGAGTPVGDPS